MNASAAKPRGAKELSDELWDWSMSPTLTTAKAVMLKEAAVQLLAYSRVADSVNACKLRLRALNKDRKS
jgi:hypothetical protein